MPPFRIEWLDEAAADVRRLDRATAMRIFDAFFITPAPAAAMSSLCTATGPGTFAYVSATIASCSRFGTTSCASPASAIAPKPTASTRSVFPSTFRPVPL